MPLVLIRNVTWEEFPLRNLKSTFITLLTKLLTFHPIILKVALGFDPISTHGLKGNERIMLLVPI